ncbi:MAG: TonB-dependent receptor [Cellvibrionaceae bacterium]
MKKYIYSHSLIFSASLLSAAVQAANLEEIIVTADFRQSELMTMPGSISVIDSSQIESRNANHLDEILNTAPNINFSAGASRGRFIQLRGIGERSQFVDPINPSVGMVIDGIDFSGLGGAGTLFDSKQVEVLRGPQGTLFGASALAGAVNISSNDATDEFFAKVTGTIGDYDTYNLGAVANGALTDSTSARIAIQQHRSNGYIENRHLNRDDTADKDEMTIRGKLQWQASDKLSINFTSMYLDIDNGYDNFTLDNSRNTLSDEPGRDAQKTFANIIKAQWKGNSVDIEGIISHTDSETEYGYDEDWTYANICTGQPCDGWSYATTDSYSRDRDSQRVEIRFLSSQDQPLFGNTHWVTGIYHYQRDVNLTREFYDWDVYADTTFTSTFDTERNAIYAQTNTQISDRLSLKIGLRHENFEADYADNLAIQSSPDEDLWGGEINLAFQSSDNTLIYGLVSRGYKTGGVNGSAMGKAQAAGVSGSFLNYLQQRLNFETETLLNWELGIKGSYLDNLLTLRVAAFHMDRDDMQLRSWYNEGVNFIGFIDNAASGTNTGLELETQYQATESLSVFANIGLLDTEIQDFFIEDGGSLIDQSGRDQSHAPSYQFNIGGQWSATETVFVRLELEGKDKFYYSNSHDEQSDSFELIHGKIGYTPTSTLEIALWGKNLTDEEYGTRGFYFANDPREFYATEVNYIQLGDPRTVGVTATYSF